MEALQLEIVTPDKVVVSTTADYVGATGVDGAFGVMPHHAPLLSALRVGELYYRQGTDTHWAFVSGGFIEVANNKVSVLAESAEMASDIDVDRAQQAKERAEERLRAPEQERDVMRAQAALQRAIERIRVASR